LLPIGTPSFHQPNPPRRSSLKPLAQGRRRPRKPSASHLELVPPESTQIRARRRSTDPTTHQNRGREPRIERRRTKRNGARGRERRGQISASPDERRGGGGERGDGDERWARRGRRRRIRDRSLGFDSAVALVRGEDTG